MHTNAAAHRLTALGAEAASPTRPAAAGEGASFARLLEQRAAGTDAFEVPAPARGAPPVPRAQEAVRAQPAARAAERAHEPRQIEAASSSSRGERAAAPRQAANGHAAEQAAAGRLQTARAQAASAAARRADGAEPATESNTPEAELDSEAPVADPLASNVPAAGPPAGAPQPIERQPLFDWLARAPAPALASGAAQDLAQDPAGPAVDAAQTHARGAAATRGAAPAAASGTPPGLDASTTDAARTEATRTGEAAPDFQARLDLAGRPGGEPPATVQLAAASAPAARPDAPAAPTPVLALAPSVGSPEFAPALATQLTTLVREGVHEARLQLNPAEMGPIAVQIALDGTQAQVDFSAAHAGTREALQAALPSLATSLHEAGLTLTGGSVFEQRDGQADAHAFAPRGGNGRAGDAADPADPAAGDTARVTLRAPRGAVDLYA